MSRRSLASVAAALAAVVVVLLFAQAPVVGQAPVARHEARPPQGRRGRRRAHPTASRTCRGYGATAP